MIIKPTLVCKNKMYFIYITIFLNSHTHTCTLKRNLKMISHPTLVCKESYYKQICSILFDMHYGYAIIFKTNHNELLYFY